MANPSAKTILIVAPHQDDEIIGCGGSIKFFQQKGYSISVVHVFLGVSGVIDNKGEESHKVRQREANNSANLLNYKLLTNIGFTDREEVDQSKLISQLIKIVRKISPSLLFIPHKNEQDCEHKIVSNACAEASWMSCSTIFPELGKTLQKKPHILCYEVWTPLTKPNIFIDITNFEKDKTAALELFASQVSSVDWVQGILGLNRYRGATLQGGGLVETFELMPTNLKYLIKTLSDEE